MEKWREAITCILDIDIEQDKVAKLNGMNRHDTSFPEVASPVLISVLIIDPILQIVWKKIFEFQRSPKLKVYFRVFAA